MKPWVQYSLIRFGAFALAFGLLMVTGQFDWWWAAVIAAVVSLCVGYIFFGALRARIATDLAERRAGRVDRNPDADAEDAVS